MAAFFLLGGGAALSAIAMALAPDRRTTALALLCALASISGLHLLLGADGLGLAELLGCLAGLGALLRLGGGRLRSAALLPLAGAALCAALLAQCGPGAGLDDRPLRLLWLVAALSAGGLVAALGRGRLRILAGLQVLIGAAAVHCLALARHAGGGSGLDGPAGRWPLAPTGRPLVTAFLLGLVAAQLALGVLLLRDARARVPGHRPR